MPWFDIYNALSYSQLQVLGSPGSNLHEVVTSDNRRFLCSLPTKFRKNIWIKRGFFAIIIFFCFPTCNDKQCPYLSGDFVVVEPIHEGDKVKAEIVRILYPKHIKVIEKDGLWYVIILYLLFVH